jgi:hypothetical protein
VKVYVINLLSRFSAKVETWASKNPDKIDAFNATVYDSTLAQVDPTKPRSEYKEVEDQKEWDKMQAKPQGYWARRCSFV